MEERMRFVLAMREEGAVKSEVCAAFGISRETSYKGLKRYEREGLAGLRDHSRAPHHHGRSRRRADRHL